MGNAFVELFGHAHDEVMIGSLWSVYFQGLNLKK